MKKKLGLIVMLGMTTIMMSGCSFSSFTGSNTSAEESEIPSDVLVASEENKISVGSGIADITVPEDYKVGSGEFTDQTGNKFNLYGIWKNKNSTDSVSENVSSNETTTVDYKSPTDKDIEFYAMYGEDTMSPDAELELGEVRTSLATYNGYLSSLISLNYPMIDDISLNDSNGQPVVDKSGNTSPRMSRDGKWYYTTFTATSGDSVSTTYNTLCYPKSYFGIMMLGTNQNEDSSRKYYIFVFSNDSTGKIMSEAEYDMLYSQIKSVYSLDGFYTAPEMSDSSMVDKSKNYYNGRTYSQFEALMEDTYNYYIIHGTDSSTSTDTGSDTSKGSSEIKWDLGHD